MTFKDRVYYFEVLFEQLQSTNSLTEKREYIAEMPALLENDWQEILKCLNGIIKFGYSWPQYLEARPVKKHFDTIEQAIQYLQEPRRCSNLTYENIVEHCSNLVEYEDFFEAIVNRTLKLGIGKSLISTSDIAPMLAKKLDDVQYINGKFTVTEKLDGNRCIARWDGTQWVFTSRNGKEMHVKFDMSGLPKEYIYDGEILSPKQVALSNAIYNAVKTGKYTDNIEHVSFNDVSGLINRHDTNKELVYNIFDIMENAEYADRRAVLDGIDYSKLTSNDVRILPVLYSAESFDVLMDKAPDLLDIVTSLGGEGLMINNDVCEYEHKRTKAILKYKKVQTMDMRVRGTEWGTGKYENMIGALYCVATDPKTNKEIICKVGSGLSDAQRELWTDGSIIGKIVEVSYFSISDVGNSTLSLRFPRLKKVREDKIITSTY